MPADDSFQVVHPLAKYVSPHYGCHSKPRPVYGAPVDSVNGMTYPYRHSTECRYDKSDTDTRCQGCPSSKSFEDWHKS